MKGLWQRSLFTSKAWYAIGALNRTAHSFNCKSACTWHLLLVILRMRCAFTLMLKYNAVPYSHAWDLADAMLSNDGGLVTDAVLPYSVQLTSALRRASDLAIARTRKIDVDNLVATVLRCGSDGTDTLLDALGVETSLRILFRTEYS